MPTLGGMNERHRGNNRVRELEREREGDASKTLWI